MKFICDSLILSDAVLRTSKACAIRSTAPVMEYIRIKAEKDIVSFLATDGELSIERKIKAEIFEEGAVCVPGKIFSDFVGKLTDCEVTIQTGGRGMEIKYLDSGTNMQTLSAEEFPDINMEIGENFIVVKKNALKRVIAETAFCCAQDDSRPILKGCLMEWKDELQMTALDGYRLAYSSAEIVSKSGENSVVCPSRTLKEISATLSDGDEEITLYTQGGMLLVRQEETTVVSRLYQGEFIRRESVIPSQFTTTLYVKKNELVSSVERAAVFIRGDKNNLITLEINKTYMKITSVSEYGNVSESIQIETEGKDLVISMNAKYLLEALHALGEEQVEMNLNGPISPFILQNKEKKDSLYLILPVRNV